MLPFPIELQPGLPVAGQVVYAVTKAVVSGQLRAGAAFPSVRQLSQELRINPNTAHRVVSELVAAGVLVATPAVGTLVAAPPPGGRRERAALLGAELERTVVEAKRLGLALEEVETALEEHWRKLSDTKKHEPHRNPRPEPALRAP